MPNLVEALIAANNKSRGFIEELNQAAEAIHGKGKTAEDDNGLRVSKALTQSLIDKTEEAIGSGDTVLMVECARLHGITGQEEDDSRHPLMKDPGDPE